MPKAKSLFFVVVCLLIVGCRPLPVQHDPPTQYPRGSTGVRTDLWDRLNDERLGRGLAPLAWAGKLSDRATAWSQTMAKKGLKHSDLSQLFDKYSYVGENIGSGSGITAEGMHLAFMRSIDHRDDMLSPGFTEGGIGVYCKGTTMWVTVEFGRKWSQGTAPAYKGGTPASPITRPDKSTARC